MIEYRKVNLSDWNITQNSHKIKESKIKIFFVPKIANSTIKKIMIQVCLWNTIWSWKALTPEVDRVQAVQNIT